MASVAPSTKVAPCSLHTDRALMISLSWMNTNSQDLQFLEVGEDRAARLSCFMSSGETGSEVNLRQLLRSAMSCAMVFICYSVGLSLVLAATLLALRFLMKCLMTKKRIRARMSMPQMTFSSSLYLVTVESISSLDMADSRK